MGQGADQPTVTTTECDSVSYTTSDGLRLTGQSTGSPDARPVLLLHGGGQTRRAWRRTSSALAAEGYCAIAVDQRGHGDSDWAPDGDYSLGRLARDAADLLHALPAPPAVIGASMGGVAALLAIGEMGAPASALVLVDTVPHPNPDGVANVMAFMRSHPEGFASVTDAADAVQEYLPHRRRPHDLSGLRHNLRPGVDGRWYWHWDPMMAGAGGPQPIDEQARLSAATAALTLPTLMVRGELSAVVDRRALDHFRSLVPHAVDVDVADAAHMVAGDDNDAFLQETIRFLLTVAPPRGKPEQTSGAGSASPDTL